ncbi:hypothetical protein Vretimale_13355 [Volvox reticuliferus]|uniref:GDP-D-glucose phosphorylase 1 n=1 Tax=Volvox reticuliferus TaxID=1737510 RepID=A0A8J4CNY6_9CHLO|nr:hypothetical protein Vretifemale_14036 [Volvox reticuliferus]GIM09522.1 hypothetical protein Vretimale_13355 [Volvox reticuliferus]
MSATPELCDRSDALRLPASKSGATIASCLDFSIPVYSFSSRTFCEDIPKLARVDSFPFVPDCCGGCDSPMPYGDASPYRPLPEDSFNNLPVQISRRIRQGAQSDICASETVLCIAHDANAVFSSAEIYTTGAPSVLTGLSAEDINLNAATVGRRAQPRRHPSDVHLPHHYDSVSLAADDSCGSDDLQAVPRRSLLEAALMAMWEDRANRGLLRYDVTQCPTRVLTGLHGFVLQLNEGRATKKRPTELTVNQVLQPFDPLKFNFTKAAAAEVLIAFRPCVDRQQQPKVLQAVEPLRNGGADVSNLVLVNVSPIDYGHVLLVPRVLDNLPQALTIETVLLALQFARELGSMNFRVGYNSLGAYATINHLHFQSYYLAMQLPCEAAATVPLPGALAAPPVPGCGEGGAAACAAAALQTSRKRPRDLSIYSSAGAVHVSRLHGYPVNAFVVEAVEDHADCDAGGMEAVAAVVGMAAERLQAANQPFNLIISSGGRRVFLFPQCFAERQAAGAIPLELLETGVNPAAFEIAGHLLLKRAQDYEGATEEFAIRLLAQASLSEDQFLAVANMCFGSGCQ